MFDIYHLHPMVVHFPIAIIFIGFLADILSLFVKKEKCLSKMGYYLEILGMLAAIVAFGSGYFFTMPMEGEAGMIRDKHELFATLTLITIIIATFFRILTVYLKKEDTNLKYLTLFLFFLAFIFVGYTGYLGGSLVFNFMIGI
ncbi:MAG: DUF2231 domain-containing protein [Bacteroidota bacterium]|nr:DUF2231 domain-containing protein [Bacteroidota bacterium]